jgi:hypothetical protein
MHGSGAVGLFVGIDVVGVDVVGVDVVGVDVVGVDVVGVDVVGVDVVGDDVVGLIGGLVTVGFFVGALVGLVVGEVVGVDVTFSHSHRHCCIVGLKILASFASVAACQTAWASLSRYAREDPPENAM